MRKILASFFLIIYVCFFLTGCATKDTIKANDHSDFDNYGYTLCARDLPGSFSTITAEYPFGEKIMVAGLNSTLKPVLGTIDTNDAFSSWPVPEKTEYIFSICSFNDGVAILSLCNSQDANDASSDVYYEITEYSSLGEITGVLKLPDDSVESNYAYHSLLYYEGFYYLLSDNSISKYDENGNCCGNIVYQDSLFLSQCIYEGGLLVCVESVSGLESAIGTELLVFDDPESMAFHSIYVDPDAFWSGLGTEDGNILFSDYYGLYRLNKNDVKETILRWDECGTNEIFTRSIFPLEKGYLLPCFDSTQILSVEHDAARTNRTKLVVLTKTESASLSSMVASFNRTNKEYYVQIQTYSNDDIDRIRVAIMAGEGPDIFATDVDSDFREIKDDQLFVDLYPYLDNDNEYSRDSLFPSILSTVEKGGKLYQLPVEFMLWTFVAPSSLEISQGASPEEFLAVIKKYDGNAPLFQSEFSRADLWYWFSNLSMGEFVQEDTNTCSFDSKEYTDLLEMCKIVSEIHGDESSMPLLYMTQLGNYLRLSAIAQIYQGDYRYVGCPAGSNTNGSAFSFTESLSISNYSKNKDGAWQFLRSSLSPSQPLSSFSSFPAAKDRFNYNLMLAIDGKLEDSGIQVLLTEYDALQIQALIDGTTTELDRHPVIIEIMKQEAERYFNGEVSAEDAAIATQRRVSIYLSERS